jgi:hypothetical protein
MASGRPSLRAQAFWKPDVEARRSPTRHLERVRRLLSLGGWSAGGSGSHWYNMIWFMYWAWRSYPSGINGDPYGVVMAAAVGVSWAEDRSGHQREWP